MKKLTISMLGLLCLFFLTSCGGGEASDATTSNAGLPDGFAAMYGDVNPPSTHNGVKMGASLADVKAAMSSFQLDYEADDASSLLYYGEMTGADEVAISFDFEEGILIYSYLSIYYEDGSRLSADYKAVTSYFEGMYGSASSSDDEAFIWEDPSKGETNYIMVQQFTDTPELMLEFDNY